MLNAYVIVANNRSFNPSFQSVLTIIFELFFTLLKIITNIPEIVIFLTFLHDSTRIIQE
jgi:hypothetical protein